VSDSTKKLNAMIDRGIAISKEEIISALPCPKGCSLSGGIAAILNPNNTMMAVSESDKLCQASAKIATDDSCKPIPIFEDD